MRPVLEYQSSAVASSGAGAYDDGTAIRPRGRPVPDYDLLRDHLSKQTLDEFVLSMEAIEEIIDDALPRASHRASWWETERAPDEKMPQREACIAAGYIATRLPDGSGVKFRKKKAPYVRKWI
ncbi:hypothetical protein V1281_006524 [Nitrobacteraceae bacterium AZCC 2161]